MPTWEARRLCPGIVFVVEDLPKYAWVSSRIFSILERFSPWLEVFSIDEAFLDITQTAQEYGGPINVARAIKRTIQQELGPCLRCSIGIVEHHLHLMGQGKDPAPLGSLGSQSP